MHTISVIIPVKNGEATLAACLKSIDEQTIRSQIDILILDSCSTDKSCEIAKRFGATIINIPSGTFSHGGTRNTGAQHAKGSLLYYTVQDARLSSTDMLEKMASHFTDIEVQAVNGIQGVPSEPDKNPAAWFQRFSKPMPEVRWFKDLSFSKLSPRQQLEFCRWDNVNAMYRRSALIAIPFRHVNFAEDALWSQDALINGCKLIRDSSLLVYHYHHHDFSYTFKVIYIINYGLLVHFKSLPVIPNIFHSIAVNVYSILKKKQINFLKKAYWIWHNVVRNFAHFSSATVFRFLHFLGMKYVDKGLQYFCSQVPQGRQTTV